MDLAVMRCVHERIANHAGEVAELFKGPVRVTIVVRDPEHPDGSRDVEVTDDDDTEALIAAIRTVRQRGVHVGGPKLLDHTRERGEGPAATSQEDDE